MEVLCKEQIIFTCKKCLFSTEYKQLVISHSKNCKGNLNICPKQFVHMFDTIKLLKEEKEKLSAQLVLERFKNKIYRHLIESNTNIRIPDILTEEEDGIHIWTGNGILPVHVHELFNGEEDIMFADTTKVERKPPARKSLKNEVDEKVSTPSSPEVTKNDIPLKKITNENDYKIKEDIDVVDDSNKLRKQSYRSIKTYVSNLVQEEQSESDRIDKITFVDSKIQNILEGFEDVKEVEKSFHEIFNTLKQSRIYTKILSDLAKKRMSIFARMSLNSYQNLLLEQIRIIDEIFREKNYSEKKSISIISKGLTPLESRLISYGNYTQTHIEIDEIQKLEIALELEKYAPKEYVPYDGTIFFNCLHNYGLVLFPMKKNIERYLFNRYDFWNVIYLQLPKNNKDDPYSFYILERVTKEKRYWKMDCRLEELSSSLIVNILPIMVGMFRKLYRDVFGDNDFRNDFSQKCQITEYDCEQLLQNIILVSQPKEFYNVVRDMVVKKALYIPTENDKFNLYGDDSLQRKRFHDKEDIDFVDVIKQLFDDISSIQAVDFYRSRTNLK